MSVYALFNIYLYIIAYLYSPNLESLDDINFKQTRKEHEQIMKQFYEQELTDIGREEDHHDSSRASINPNKGKPHAEKRRRDMKKDPAEKAKEVRIELLKSNRNCGRA